MSIPKIIHYCWFGGNPKPELILKCIESWKKFCPDWKIIEWNESNFDVNFCAYTAKAYKQQRYGFLTDVVRLKVVYDLGGIYMDADVELRRSLNDLLSDSAWFTYGTATEINTGSGFGAEPQHWFVEKLLNNYTSFSQSARFELCTRIDTAVFKKHFPNYLPNGGIDLMLQDVRIVSNIWHYGIHHYTGSWQSPLQKLFNKAKIIKSIYFGIRKHFKKKRN